MRVKIVVNMSSLQVRLQKAKAENIWLLCGLLLAFMPHFLRLSPLIILPSAILLFWRLLFELQYVALPPRFLRWLLTFIGIAATYASFHTLIGRQAGVGLLVIMLSLKLMEMNSQRDVGVVTGLGFFVVITVFLFNQSIFMGIYMMLVVILLVVSLVAFSRDQSRISQLDNVKKGSVIIAQALPLMLLMFVLFPRIPGPLWNLPADAAGAGTGLSDSMSPGAISQLSDNNSVAFRVQFKNEKPGAKQLYWRGPVFTQFDGKTWSKDSKQGLKNRATIDLRYRVSNEPSLYSVTLEPHQQRWLFALDLPAQVPDGAGLSADFELLAKKPVQQLMRYDMRSFTDYQLASSDVPEMTTYLQLPLNGGPRARELAQSLWQQSANNQRYVDTVLRYLATEPFYYSRQPPLLLTDPIDEFLFGSKSGFCEHYASTFVFLMRAAGLPARVVTGYQGGEMNPQSDYFIVRQSDAHAWAEVWLQGKGWKRIDPTAVIPASRIENQQDLARIRPEVAELAAVGSWLKNIGRQLGFGWDRINHTWNQWVINYNSERQKDFLSRLLGGDNNMQIDWREMVSWLVGGMIFVLFAVALYLMRPWHKRLSDPAQAAYEEFCRRLVKRGVVRLSTEGPLDFAQRAMLAQPERAREIKKITTLYERQRYAPYPTRQNLQHLQEAVRSFKA